MQARFTCLTKKQKWQLRTNKNIRSRIYCPASCIYYILVKGSNLRPERLRHRQYDGNHPCRNERVRLLLHKSAMKVFFLGII